MPFTPDITRAWWSRIIIFQFDKTFMRGDPRTDERLLEKLTTDEELSGILNLALRGRKRLMQNHSFSYSKTPEDVEEIWNLSCDSVYAWKEARCERDDDESVSKVVLYKDYVDWCRERHVHPLANNKFFSQLYTKCPWLSAKRPTRDSARVNEICGLSLKGYEQEEERPGQTKLPENDEVPDENNPDGRLAPSIGQGCQGKKVPLGLSEEDDSCDEDEL
jgi:putative DNA primase/helicase